jgi:cytochrome c-type biogenesis protein CcmH
MTAFIVIAALLIAGALAFVLPPLISRQRKSNVLRSQVNAAVYRDQMRELESDVRGETLAPEEYEKAKHELEARVLEDVVTDEAAEPAPARGRWAVIGAGIAIPVLAITLYVLVGTPQALSPQAAMKSESPEVTEQQVIEMVERLAVRLKENPDDAKGWMMLGRSYSVLGRFQEASQAYAAAVQRVPNDAQLLADYADVLAMAQGRKLQGEPEKIIARALAIDANNPKALALAGSVSFEKKDYTAAADYWERILRAVPPDSDIAKSVASSVAEARKLAGGGVPAAAGAAPAAAAPAPPAASASPRGGADRASVSGVVSLKPDLASKVGPNDIVFIYARAAEGPRVPLAVVRKPARELPVQFTLDDSMAMAPNMKLSSFPRVIVAARISKSGNAQPQPGDLQGASGAIANATSGVKVVIDSEVQ